MAAQQRPALDYDQSLGACINAMMQDDSTGQTLVFKREQSSLNVEELHASYLLETGIDHYELVVFDGGNTHGDSWKHIFFPALRLHHFVYEDI
ncbi:uridylate kinase [Pseudomonas aeruginosa]|nr:uridylate kinase [Pseudomonas aeruginosa]